MYQLSRAEQETTLRWDAEDQTAHIFTATPATLRKLDRLAAEFPEVYRCTWTDSKYHAKRYEVDARYIRFAKPPTEAKRRQAARMNSQRSAQRNNVVFSASALSDGEILVQTPDDLKTALQAVRKNKGSNHLPKRRA